MGVKDVFKEIGKKVVKFAPLIGNTLLTAVPGGPIAKAAVAAVAGAVGSDSDDPDRVLAALSVTDPAAAAAQAASLRAADQQFRLEVMKVDAADRASARAMQTATKSLTPSILSYLAVGGLFGYVFLWQWMAWTGKEVGAQADNVFFFTVGLLGNLTAQAFNFYLGSSNSGEETGRNMAHILRGKR